MKDELRNTIYELEQKLQKHEVRKSVDILDEIISDELIEVTSKGTLSTKNDCLINLPAAPEIHFEMTDFSARLLAPDLVQTFFKTKKTIVDTNESSISIRNTIWKNENGKWKMVFHQGTPLKV